MAPVGKPQPHVGADAERNSGLYARRRDGTPSTTIEAPPPSSSVATGEEAADGSCRRPNTSGQMQKKQGFGRGAERGKTFIENRSSSSIVAPLQPAPTTARRLGSDSNADSSPPGCAVGTKGEGALGARSGREGRALDGWRGLLGRPVAAWCRAL